MCFCILLLFDKVAILLLNFPHSWWIIHYIFSCFWATADWETDREEAKNPLLLHPLLS
jgi:hypothetical protein